MDLSALLENIRSGALDGRLCGVLDCDAASARERAEAVGYLMDYRYRKFPAAKKKYEF